MIRIASASDHKDLAYVLDTAEYLPMLMLEERDATSDVPVHRLTMRDGAALPSSDA
jgi:hypothetical protein